MEDSERDDQTNKHYGLANQSQQKERPNGRIVEEGDRD